MLNSEAEYIGEKLLLWVGGNLLVLAGKTRRNYHYINGKLGGNSQIQKALQSV